MKLDASMSGRFDGPQTEGEETAEPPAPGRRTLGAGLVRTRQRKAGPGRPPSGAREVDLAAPTDALPPEVRATMEAAFGYDFSAVRVREGGYVAEAGARAYAQGNELHFAPGQYDPWSAAGRELIGHELAHVVQQASGRVSGEGLVADDALEAEADEMGARAARGEPSGTAGGGELLGLGAGAGPAQPKLGIVNKWVTNHKTIARRVRQRTDEGGIVEILQRWADDEVTVGRMFDTWADAIEAALADGGEELDEEGSSKLLWVLLFLFLIASGFGLAMLASGIPGAQAATTRTDAEPVGNAVATAHPTSSPIQGSCTQTDVMMHSLSEALREANIVPDTMRPYQSGTISDPVITLGSRQPQPRLPRNVEEAVRAALERSPAQRGKTWDETRDNQLGPDWLVQSPPASHWGKPYEEQEMPVTCTPTDDNAATCHPDFGLERCEGKPTDCHDQPELCRPLEATRTRPDAEAENLCVGHSDQALVDEVWEIASGARQIVDVVSLGAPDGRFEASLRNAITFLDSSDQPVVVRVLYSAWPGAANEKQAEPDALVSSLSRDLPRDHSPVSIFAAEIAMAKHSWNHAKIVAADGETALIGGHNMWDRDYLNTRPVHDVSARVSGGAARHSQQYADQLWKWSCGPSNRKDSKVLLWGARVRSWKNGVEGNDCPGPAQLSPSCDLGGGTTIFSVGRLAEADPRGQQADDAILAMLDASRHMIRLSQQTMGQLETNWKSWAPIRAYEGSWGPRVLDALARAIVDRDVSVEIVVSNPSGRVIVGVDHDSYDGVPPGRLASSIRERARPLLATELGHTPSERELDRELTGKLRIGQIRVSPSWDSYPGDARMPGNHAKTILVDDEALYVGSENLYSFGALSEYGIIIMDPMVDGITGSVVRTYLQDYWEQLWAASYRNGAQSNSTFERY